MVSEVVIAVMRCLEFIQDTEQHGNAIEITSSRAHVLHQSDSSSIKISQLECLMNSIDSVCDTY